MWTASEELITVDRGLLFGMETDFSGTVSGVGLGGLWGFKLGVGLTISSRSFLRCSNDSR